MKYSIPSVLSLDLECWESRRYIIVVLSNTTRLNYSALTKHWFFHVHTAPGIIGISNSTLDVIWLHHGIAMFSAWLIFCDGNPPVTGLAKHRTCSALRFSLMLPDVHIVRRMRLYGCSIQLQCQLFSHRILVHDIPLRLLVWLAIKCFIKLLNLHVNLLLTHHKYTHTHMRVYVKRAWFHFSLKAL